MLSGARSTMLYAIPYCIRKTAEKAAPGMPIGVPGLRRLTAVQRNYLSSMPEKSTVFGAAIMLSSAACAAAFTSSGSSSAFSEKV